MVDIYSHQNRLSFIHFYEPTVLFNHFNINEIEGNPDRAKQVSFYSTFA